jgi:hypothetical protein
MQDKREATLTCWSSHRREWLEDALEVFRPLRLLAVFVRIVGVCRGNAAARHGRSGPLRSGIGYAYVN